MLRHSKWYCSDSEGAAGCGPVTRYFPTFLDRLDMVTVTTSITDGHHLIWPLFTLDWWPFYLWKRWMMFVCCAHVHGCSQTRCWIPLELELKLCAALSSLMWELEMECRQLRSHSFQWAISPAPRWSFFPGFFPTFIEYAKGPDSLQWPARTKARAFLQFCKKSR